MNVSIHKKISRMCYDADNFAHKRLSVAVRNIDEVLSVKLTGEWLDLPAKKKTLLSEALAEATNMAELADAANFANEKLFTCGNRRVIFELPLLRNLHDVQNQIAESFKDSRMPQRGFVYLAWRRKPEKFLYVGKASNASRLNLARHGKLARATAEATTICLLFPSQSKEDVLSGLEACIIRLIEASTGSLPKLNKRREAIPPGPASDELEHHAKFLRDVAARLTPYER